MKIKLLTRCRCSRFVEINYKSPSESDTFLMPLPPRCVPAKWPVEDHPAMPIRFRRFVFQGAYDTDSGAPIYCEAES